ncbi:hypothetical protein QWZ14_09055, partial [Paeniroseomonas aquatica]
TSAEVRKMSYTGRVPTSGTIGLEIDRLVTELIGAGILPANSKFPQRQPSQSDLLTASTDTTS